MEKPDFYGIGVQKAGTTWLHAQLVRHPDIFMPPLKEIQYFNHIYLPEHRGWTDQHRKRHLDQILNYQESLENNQVMVDYLKECKTNKLTDEWYLHFFSIAKEGQITGEITPEYSLLPKEGIEHMLRINSSAKFILLLRHPLERDFSHAKMILEAQGGLQKGEEMNEEIENRLLEILDMPGVYERSDYKTIIEKWKINIPNDKNLFIGFYDWIKNRPHDLLKETCSFLDIEYKDSYFKQTDKVVFKGNSLKMTETIRETLLPRHLNTMNYINKEYQEGYGIDWK